MSEFVKPVTKEIAFKLRKDLTENEEICPTCKGVGLVIQDNPYGLKGDPDKRCGVFPYKHQSLTFCPTCYNGVVNRCKYCGKIIPRYRIKCDCPTSKDVEWAAILKKDQETLDKAEVVPEENFEMFYIEHFNCGDDGYFSEWQELFDAYEEALFDGEVITNLPLFVYGTQPVEMTMDAYSIVESATEDLYEDAFDMVTGEEIKELQEYLDSWCKHCSVGTTYYPDKRYKVRIPWEEYEMLEE